MHTMRVRKANTSPSPSASNLLQRRFVPEHELQRRIRVAAHKAEVTQAILLVAVGRE